MTVKELIEKRAKAWETILTNRKYQLQEIKVRLSNIVKKYGDARKTELTHIELKPEEKEINL